MSKARSFEITCPCCHSRIRVDAQNRAVLSHEPPPKKQVVSDLAEAARALHEKESQREEQFRKSFEAERQRGKILQRKFAEAFEKAKEEPLTPPPVRDIDLD